VPEPGDAPGFFPFSGRRSRRATAGVLSQGFYDDHVKRHKKRPIYWLISSPKRTLQALIYLHRYNRDTVNQFPSSHLRTYQQKLEIKRVSAAHVLTGGGSGVLLTERRVRKNDKQ
jgi:hypothetical protein